MSTIIDITVTLHVGKEYAGDGDWDCDSIDSLAAELAARWDVSTDTVDTWVEEAYLTVGSEAEVAEVKAIVRSYAFSGSADITVSRPTPV